ERAAFLAFRLQPEARQMSSGIGNCDALVTGHTSHSESPVSREVVVETVAHVAGRQVEFGAVVVGGSIQVTLLDFRLFGDLKPDRVPGIVILDARRDGGEFLEARR